MSVIVSTSGCLHSEFVSLLFLKTHRETDLFFCTSGVQFDQCNQFHYRHATFSSHLKSKYGNILDKVETLRSTLNINDSLYLEVFQSPSQPSVCESCMCVVEIPQL
jgi:hypothetical protein